MIRLHPIVLSLTLFCLVNASWGHTDDFQVGVDPTTNQLKIDYDTDLYPWELPTSGEPQLPGFALDDPGFASIGAGDAVAGLFEPLNPQANISLRVQSTSAPEMKVWNPLDPGGAGMQILGDNMWNIGSAPFDIHPWWQIDTSDPQYDPGHAPWGVTFQLVDYAGQYSASDPLTVTFTPEPAGLALVALAATAVGWRRRWPQAASTAGPWRHRRSTAC